ncbi:MAG: anti-sigma factor antagonist [Coriobacteriia bacterium]
MVPFDISSDSRTHVCVIRLSGDIDTAIVPQLRAALGDVLDDSQCTDLVLDLAEVTYADSSALGLLIWLDHSLRPQNGRLVLAGANPDVSRILELSGLANVAASIAMSSNVNEALEGLELPECAIDPLWVRELCIVADVHCLGEARDTITEILRPLEFADSTLFDIKVALGEALANAVRHGRPEGGDNPDIEVRVAAYPDRAVLEILDRGRGYDGIQPQLGDDLYAASGRGVMFMRALMDRVDFEPRPGGGTIVRLVKHRQKTRDERYVE